MILLVELIGLGSFTVTSFLLYTEGEAVLFPRGAVGARLSRKDYGLSLIEGPRFRGRRLEEQQSFERRNV